MKISDETKVGIMAAFGITLLIIGYSFLRGNNVFEKKTYYYAVYDKVDGLTTSDPVTFHGLPVGKVMSLDLLDDTSGRSIAKILMKKDIKIPANSAFQLYSADFLGEKAVQLIIGDAKQYAQNGDTLQGNIAASLTEEVSMQILPVKQKAEDLLGSIDSTITILKVILKGGQIESSMNNIESVTVSFSKIAKNIDTLIATQRQTLSRTFTNIEHITANLDSNNENITRMFENLAQLSDTLSEANIKETVSNLNSSLVELEKLLANINNGEGTMGMLVTDKALYENLTKSTANLESLLADLEANPKRYVHFSLFGGGKDKAEAPNK